MWPIFLSSYVSFSTSFFLIFEGLVIFHNFLSDQEHDELAAMALEEKKNAGRNESKTYGHYMRFEKSWKRKKERKLKTDNWKLKNRAWKKDRDLGLVWFISPFPFFSFLFFWNRALAFYYSFLFLFFLFFSDVL